MSSYNILMYASCVLQGVDTDLEFVKIKCSTNIEKLNYNSRVLKKKIEDNNFKIISQKRKIHL